MPSEAVSIVIPVYNAASTLSFCIDCVLAQTFSDFQLILVDDGSTDCSGVICDQYESKDSRIKVIHKKNGGVSSARNAGLAVVSGRYVCFADADDYVESIWLEQLMSLSSYCNEYVPVCQVMQHKADGQKLLYNLPSGVYAWNRLYSGEGWGYSYNKLFLTERIARMAIRFDESLKVYEDELFVASYCTGLRGFVFTERPLYHYIVPEFFEEKYYDRDFVRKLLYQYSEMKKVNREASNYVVDRLVMASLSSYQQEQDISVVDALCNLVGHSIRHVRGMKKIPLKLLSVFNNHKIWIVLFKIYAKLDVM